MSGRGGKVTAVTRPADLNNALLQQTEKALEARLTPETRVDYLKVLVAGLHIVLNNGPQGFMAKLDGSKDPIADCAKGAAALVLIMRKQAKGEMPMQAGIPAGFGLMLYGLDFIERTSGMKIAEPELVRATKLYGNNLFHRLGITPTMLQNATRKVHSIAESPDDMAKLNLKAGLTRHPDAAVPSEIPGIPTMGAG